MARVWFVNRVGNRFSVPGGLPAYELPLDALSFKLDLGPQRRLDESFVPKPEPGGQPSDLSQIHRTFVQVEAADIEGKLFTEYRPGWYDSPYSPSETARRLGGRPWAGKAAAA